MNYIKYDPIGNTIGLEVDFLSYWEIDTKGDVRRSIDINKENILRYDEEHAADGFSQLPEGPITKENLEDTKFGSCTEIKKEEFEELWIKPAINRN